MLGGIEPRRRPVCRIGVLSLSPGKDIDTDCARDIEGVKGATELAREREGVRPSTDPARDSDGVRGRSRSGAGGARDQPNKDVKIASSEGWPSDGGGEDREPSVVGVAGGSSSEIEGVGRRIEERVERREFIWVEVYNINLAN